MTKELILKIVCDTLNVEIRDVLQESYTKGAKCANVIQARHLSMFFCRAYKLGTFAVIGKYFNRDHSSVTQAERAIQNDIDTNKNFRLIYERIDKQLKFIDEFYSNHLNIQPNGTIRSYRNYRLARYYRRNIAIKTGVERRIRNACLSGF